MGEKLGDYFVLQRKMLKLGGMSLRPSETIYYRMYSNGFQILLVIYFMTLFLDIVLNVNDFVIVVNTIYHILAISAVLVKLRMVSINGPILGKRLDALEKGVFAWNENRGGGLEKKLIRKCIRNSRFQSILGCSATLIATLIPTIATMTNHLSTKNSDLPFGKFTIFQSQQSPNFELAWLFQSITFPLSTVVYLSTDFIVADVSAHLCVQFKILENSLKRIFLQQNLKGGTWKSSVNEAHGITNNIFVKNNKSDWNHYFRIKLKGIVQHHIAIINIGHLFEEIFNILVLADYFTVLLVLGCILYLGSLYPPTDPFFQKFAMLAFGAVFQLLLISYWGNEVMLQSREVLKACYNVNLVGTDLRLQKGLLLMMTRSSKPINFTIGKYINLSLTSFVAVLRASYSCYMVLQSTNKSI